MSTATTAASDALSYTADTVSGAAVCVSTVALQVISALNEAFKTALNYQTNDQVDHASYKTTESGTKHTSKL